MYRCEHLDKARAAAREYYLEHREEILARRRERYQKTPEKNKAYYRKNR